MAKPTAEIEAEVKAEPEELFNVEASEKTPKTKTAPKRKKIDDNFDGSYWMMKSPRRVAQVRESVEEEVSDEVLHEEEEEEERESAEEELGLMDMIQQIEESPQSATELRGAYFNSEADRLRNRAPLVAGEAVPDVATGVVSMDGLYWNISGSSRSRQRRQLDFFPESHLPASVPSAPRAPLSPETIARRRETQRVATEQRRHQREAERAESDREFGALVRFLSSGREVVPNLFIGGRLAAENDVWLDSSVDYVVNLSGMQFAYERRRDASHVLKLELADAPHADAHALFELVVDAVDRRLAAGERVLIHCRLGRSRSATMMAAFLVGRRNMSLQSALHLISETNNGHRINSGFLTQLMRYECECNGLAESSIHSDYFTRGGR